MVVARGGNARQAAAGNDIRRYHVIGRYRRGAIIASHLSESTIEIAPRNYVLAVSAVDHVTVQGQTIEPKSNPRALTRDLLDGSFYFFAELMFGPAPNWSDAFSAQHCTGPAQVTYVCGSSLAV